MTDTTTEPTQPYDSLQAILDDLRPADGIYKREAINAAIAQREAITPYLLQSLDETLADPESHFTEYGYIYATMLLGYFKEPAAHEKIAALFSLPEAQLDQLFGEMVTEDLPSLLLRTSNGSVDRIKAMILDPTVYEYSRSSAIQALTFAVLEGHVTREETIEFLTGLLTGDEAQNDEYIFWTTVVIALCDLHPVESMAVIEGAFERGLVDEWIISMDSVRETCAESQEETLARLLARMEHFSLDDVHEAMALWAAFDDHEEATAESLSLLLSQLASLPVLTRSEKHKSADAKKKKRNKAAKAMRKKQRRKKK